MILVQLPFENIVLDVLTNSGEIFFIPNDMIVEAWLPTELLMSCVVNPFGASGFELADD